MKCSREGCSKDIKGRALFCSGACRTAHSRRCSALSGDTPTVTLPAQNVTLGASTATKPPITGPEVLQESLKNPVSSEIPRKNGISTPVTPTPDSGSESRIASIDDYHAHREDYAERACPELLNWGPWMNVGELSEARLSGNRLTVPGDWDYVPEEVALKESCYL